LESITRRQRRIKIVDDPVEDRDYAGMIRLCRHCALHEAEVDGYCSDVCRRSEELLLAAIRVVERAKRGKRLPLRRLARALDALR
jgi:hypothetical protein